ncbi:YlcI/YnfO family protein [Phytobacter diazotrophicus]|uniref:YlcI/YnfO family protein n=1 Tax=Phytobacter diazotrophicus TaxID=395631 RepID=UPI002FF39885
MATGAKNAKSQMTTVRIPHEVMEDIERLREDGESTAGFLVTAAKGEIKRRQRKQAKEAAKE